MITTSISENILNVVPILANKATSSILVASFSPPNFKILTNYSRNLSSFGGVSKLPGYNFGRAFTLRPVVSLDGNDDHFIFNLFVAELSKKYISLKEIENVKLLRGVTAFSSAIISWLSSSQVAYSSTEFKINPVYEVGELFELGIQLSYVLLLLALLGAGTFFVLRQVLVRRELDLSAKELQEQVRSGDANATELFELGAVMLRRKYYPAATKYLLQAIEKWDGDDQDLAQVHNALGVSYVRDGKLEKGINQFEKAVKLQPGYVTAWNNLGDAYEEKKDLNSALKAFEEVLLFDPNNRVARPRIDDLRKRVNMYKGIPVKKER
ncbi:hypothetical protein KSS87_013545 [Heliosperma pusillum]|nr:hypothetical protein KSS87_013545 [Heliosperma pusillum]